MKVHLRLTERDVDLCRWRHSIKWGMMTYYVGQILIAETNGKIAYLPTALNLSAKTNPCDVYMIFTDKKIVEFLQSFPARKRNDHLKRIIRKHLKAQIGQQINELAYQEPEVEKKIPAPKPKNNKSVIPKVDKPIVNEPRKEIVESEEDRAAILALIAMGGE